MSSEYNMLRALELDILRAVDMAAVRALLRAERKKRRMSLDELAKNSGLTRSAIHDVEKNPKSQPRFDTVARLIEGMPGLRLSDFFLTIERQTNAEARGKKDAPANARAGTQIVEAPRGASTNNGATDLVSPGSTNAVAVEALLDISNRIIDALEALGRPREENRHSR